MAFIKDSYLAVGVHKHFDIKGFNTTGIWGQRASEKLSVGFSLDQFGDKLYHEARLGIGLAKKIDRIALGLKTSYLNTGIQNMSSRQTLLTEFGIMTTLSQKVNLGFRAINLTRARLYESQPLPTLLSLGIYFVPYSKLGLGSQIDYAVGTKSVIRAGLNYKLTPQFTALVGVSPSSKSLHAGVSFKLKKYQFQYAIANFSGIGLSSQFSLVLTAPKKSTPL
jgi:hypothetical protein